MALFLVFIFIVFGTTITNAVTDQSDVSALNAMYQSLNSPPQLTKWTSTGGDPCADNWKGLTCSASRVTQIDISYNNLGNQIPYSLPPNVTSLNLAGCGYTGNLPYSISQMTSLKYLNVANNKIDGALPDMFGQLTALSTLDISSNSFTGDLPQSLSALSSATDMYLQNNQFTGTIDVLANLPLKNLNVANNKFTGWIPNRLNNINLQKDGNLWNSGPAPPSPPGPPAAAGGGSQNRQPSGNNPSTGGSSDSGKKSGVGGGAIAGIVISILVVAALIAFFLFKRRSKKTSADIEKTDDQFFAPVAPQQHAVQEMKPVQAFPVAETKTFETIDAITLKPPPMDHHKSFDDDDFSAIPITPKKVTVAPPDAISYSIADLQIATDSFSADNLIGEGSTGRVFRAQFEDGKVVAVKKLKPSALPGRSSDDFIDIVSDVSRLRHPNVVELVGYCSEYGQHLLVYEFLVNGSLYDFLHLSDEYSKPLIWNSRVKIALGTARALEYLHEVCSPSVVHKNIKSANILLDAELNPHLSDSGLASLASDADQGLDDNGYSAPEVSMSGQYTVKSDVYGFGVTMLELLTGRKPFDSSRTRAEQSLVRWATPQLHDMDALAKMVDPALKGLYPVKSLSRFADVIALCVQAEPEFRPPMSEVVQALVRLVQRANMSKRTVGIEHSSSLRSGNQDSHESL
ncbi:leucine-rich repeat protein [Artemisia annua]|uniref:Leucine-rich repeat protein n=1 Tax=Artemisia annua TaxID=35608 RepID=A0A2U1LDD6_ARTAN|nr:leucine-rich repeat protein [Artemisia annua]